ncbi:MAG: hypothetical protein ACE5DS_08985, partial [Kiloniellaceae bacterium]
MVSIENLVMKSTICRVAAARSLAWFMGYGSLVRGHAWRAAAVPVAMLSFLFLPAALDQGAQAGLVVVGLQAIRR